MIPSYLRPDLRMLIWSLLLVVWLHFATYLNPFQGVVISGITFIAVVVQLILLRRKGLIYVGIFLLWLIVLTTVFSYVEGKIFDHKRRYYSIH